MQKEMISVDDLLQMFEDLRLRAVQSDGSENKSNTYSCPKCQDKGGLIIRDKDSIETWVSCECKEQRQVDRLFKSSQITGQFQKVGFGSFILEGRPTVIRQAHDCARTYFKNFEAIKEKRQNSIALLGSVGAGKTHLLTAISNNLIKKGVGVSYFPWVEGFNEIKDNLNQLEARIRNLQRASVLFIDDLFKGRKEPTEFQVEQLFAIVNYRYLNNLPIMISSERDIDQICAIDDAIGSRIYEMARDYVVIIQGEGLNYRINGGVAS